MTEVSSGTVKDPFTALVAAEERAAFLAAAVRQVSGSLDLTQTRRLGVRACVPRLADWVQLLIVDGTGTATVMYLRAGDTHPTEASVVAPRPSLSGTGRVLATGRSELLHVVTGPTESADFRRGTLTRWASPDGLNDELAEDLVEHALHALGASLLADDRTVLADTDRWLTDLFTSRGFDPLVTPGLWRAVRETVGELLPPAWVDLTVLAKAR